MEETDIDSFYKKQKELNIIINKKVERLEYIEQNLLKFHNTITQIN